MDVLVAVPEGADADGAVAELWCDDDGFWWAEIRIPAPEQP